jgi:hypothetical protein
MIRSLTYSELAETLKITPDSANRLARRKHWPRTKGNDGRVRVSVPEEALVRQASPPDSPGDSPPVSPLDDNPVHVQIARLEGELAGVREALTEARARAAAAETRSAELSVDLAAERTRADKAIGAFASLADRLDALAAANQPQPILTRLKRLFSVN